MRIVGRAVRRPYPARLARRCARPDRCEGRGAGDPRRLVDGRMADAAHRIGAGAARRGGPGCRTRRDRRGARFTYWGFSDADKAIIQADSPPIPVTRYSDQPSLTTIDLFKSDEATPPPTTATPLPPTP